MSAIDWNLLQYMYEVYHTSIPELAIQYGVSENMITFVSEQHMWKRSKLAESARDWRDASKSDTDTIDEVQERMNAISLLNQYCLNPKMQALEVHIINKAIDVTQSIDPDSPQGAEAVQKMGALLEKLKSTNPAIQAHLNSHKAQSDSGSGSIKIQVITGFANKSQDVIEVSAATPRLAETSSESVDLLTP